MRLQITTEVYFIGIDFLTIRGAGHFVSSSNEKPKEALQMFYNYINGKDYSSSIVADKPFGSTISPTTPKNPSDTTSSTCPACPACPTNSFNSTSSTCPTCPTSSTCPTCPTSTTCPICPTSPTVVPTTCPNGVHSLGSLLSLCLYVMLQVY